MSLRAALALIVGGAAFAACAPTAAPGQAEPPPIAGLGATAGLGETLRTGSVTLTPLRILEDSRCPASVQCVQAGTVRLAVRASAEEGSREVALRLGEPQQVWPGTWLLLAAVCPQPRLPGAIAPEAYSFTFSIGLGAPPPEGDVSCPAA